MSLLKRGLFDTPLSFVQNMGVEENLARLIVTAFGSWYKKRAKRSYFSPSGLSGIIETFGHPSDILRWLFLPKGTCTNL
ncbi:MAG: hypothetical protein PUC12_11565 [Clostridiales bacterium]|nr:hypothetical protein [Clostridiales bacterium]